VRGPKEEPEVIVLQIDAVMRERASHDRCDVDLVLGCKRKGLGEVERELFRRRESLTGKGGDPRSMAFEGDLVAPFVLHERPAPVEENGLQHPG
jgi:hypothetical protein